MLGIIIAFHHRTLSRTKQMIFVIFRCFVHSYAIFTSADFNHYLIFQMCTWLAEINICLFSV